MNRFLPQNETARKYLAFIAGLFFMGLGIAFTRHGGLGVSPISSIPNVISEKYTFISFGTWLFIWNMTMLLAQILILRSKFEKRQLLQIPLSLIFGAFTDVGGVIANRFPVEIYSFKWMSVVIGTVILAFGISITVIAGVILNSGEATVKAISDTINKQFGNVKIVFDVSCVVISIIISLLLFDMQIVGTREGTIFAAVFTGMFVKLIIPSIKADMEKWIKNTL